MNMPNHTMAPECLKVLDIGAGEDSIALEFFKPLTQKGYNLVISTLDINRKNKPDIVHDIRKRLPAEHHKRYNLVLASHVLEHIDRVNCLAALRNMAEALKPEGELWVITPSLEWAAQNIIKNGNIMASLAAIYGAGDRRHKYMNHQMGFTLPLLRNIFSVAGLTVRKAYQSPYWVAVKEGDATMVEYELMQNIVMGVRIDGG